MRLLKAMILAVAAASLLAASARAQDVEEVRADKIALQAGRIITVAGDEIEDGTILIENGRIKEVGRDLAIPFDFWVIDARDKVVFPGMVEAHTTRGLDRANESLPVVPFLSVVDALDPSSLDFEDALRDGITTLLISQGNNTCIGGMTRVVRPIGMTVDAMTVKADAGLKISVAPMDGQDRMTQMALFRQTFRELDEYLGNLAETRYEEECKKKNEEVKVAPAEAREKGKALVKDADLDFTHRDLKRLVDGRLGAFVYCDRAMDVINAAALAEENGFLQRTVFVLGNEAYKAAPLIKATGRPVILDADMVYREEDPLTGEETEIFVPLEFYEAGIPFAVSTNPRDVYGARYPWYQAARLVRNGIPRNEALRAITQMPAVMIGVGDRLGAIAPGYDATLLVLTGDPLDSTTWVDSVFIDGRLVYERAKDFRLKELLTGREVPPEERKEAEGDLEEQKQEQAPAGGADGAEKKAAADAGEARSTAGGKE